MSGFGDSYTSTDDLGMDAALLRETANTKSTDRAGECCWHCGRELPLMQPKPTPAVYLISVAQLGNLMRAASLLLSACEEPRAQEARELVLGVVKAARKVNKMTKNDELLMNDDVGRDVALIAGYTPRPTLAAEAAEAQAEAGVNPLLALIYEYREVAEQRGATKAKGRPNLALTATLNEMELRIAEQLDTERQAHAATRTELEQMREALAEAEALAQEWSTATAGHRVSELTPFQWSQLQTEEACGAALSQALAKAKAGG